MNVFIHAQQTLTISRSGKAVFALISNPTKESQRLFDTKDALLGNPLVISLIRVSIRAAMRGVYEAFIDALHTNVARMLLHRCE
ncbi:MAG TPA: hypothetical protein VH593_30575 [Ktedonobacteraceae bacterium]